MIMAMPFYRETSDHQDPQSSAAHIHIMFGVPHDNGRAFYRETSDHQDSQSSTTRINVIFAAPHDKCRASVERNHTATVLCD